VTFWKSSARDPAWSQQSEEPLWFHHRASSNPTRPCGQALV